MCWLWHVSWTCWLIYDCASDPLLPDEGDPDHPALYYSYIPAMAERHQMRRFDAMALKDLRKRLDSGALEQHEVDQIATDLLEDCVDVGQARQRCLYRC